MIYKGDFFDIDSNGITGLVRVNPDEIMDELQRSINHMKEKIASLEKELVEVRSEKYKDEELQKMKKELQEIKDERYYGFEITKEEYDKIQAWKDDWFKRKNGGSHYMGAVGGGFTYEFLPTGIGTCGKVIAPDGEEFEFQELG